MSAGGPGRREVAYRLFAAEFDDATLDHSNSDDERAPNYVVTPSGARVNRLFVEGVLTEVESVGDGILRARVADPTGAFVLYAGQYQADAAAFLDGAEVPSFVAVTGKARTYRPDGAERVFTSIRPESINAVDAASRDRWTVQAAEHTLDRIAVTARAIERPERRDDLRGALLAEGIEPGLAAGIPLAIEHYGTTTGYLDALSRVALDAVRVVAGESEEVEPLGLAPDEGGDMAVDLAVSPATTKVTAGVTEAAGTTDVGVAPGEEAEADDEVPPEGVTEEDIEAPPERKEPEPEAAKTAEAGGGLYEFEEGERERIEEEFGAEFASGSEMEGPDETDSGAPRPVASEVADGAEVSEEDDAEEVDDKAAAEAGEIDLEEEVVGTMRDLDGGHGADREAVVDEVASAAGVDAEAVEEAIQAALMSGRCYEPEDGRLKAI